VPPWRAWSRPVPSCSPRAAPAAGPRPGARRWPPATWPSHGRPTASSTTSSTASTTTSRTATWPPRADLRAAAVTERRFDRQLTGLSLPLRAEPVVRLLYRVNQARAALTSTAAGATSLRALRGYQRRLDAANEPVEDAIRVIRDLLGLPPPDTS
jgi:hypothetical protein